jgi:hypothetical protein
MVATSMTGTRPGPHAFYVGMAGLFVVMAFGGFVPTYWARISAPGFHANPIVHIHGALFFIWTLYFFAQTALVALGRTPDHRSWGLAGISLGTLMAVSIVLATINSMVSGQAAGFAVEGREFAIVPLGALPLFVGFFAAAIANVKRPETHKRYMLMTMIPLMHAAMFRLYQVYFAPAGPPGPPAASHQVPPGLFVDLLIVAAMAYDWRTRGRPHRVYWICLPLAVGEQLISTSVAGSQAWLSFAAWVQSLAG